MDSLPHDLLAIILAKLSLKRITTSKLVCRQWKSILESKFFYQLFQSHHHKSHSLWSLMCRVTRKEIIAHYGCKNWGLTRSLGSYISFFITSLFLTEEPRVVAYSDVGLMLIRLANRGPESDTYYVANPISREYVKIPPIVPCISWETTVTTAGLVTQVEDNVVLSYKIVLIKFFRSKSIEKQKCLLIYSSDTGLWRSSTIQSLNFLFWPSRPVSLNGNLYWIGKNYTLGKLVLVYHNFYATGTESDGGGVIPLPGVRKNNMFNEVCATCEGSLLYMEMNIFREDKDDGSFGHKLSVWKLHYGEWQIVSEISIDYRSPDEDSDEDDDSLGYFQFTINPFDAKTVYFWSKEEKSLAYINLDRCKTGLHNNFECGSDDCIQGKSEEWYLWEDVHDIQLQMVSLPCWLYRIPCSPP